MIKIWDNLILQLYLKISFKNFMKSQSSPDNTFVFGQISTQF